MNPSHNNGQDTEIPRSDKQKECPPKPESPLTRLPQYRGGKKIFWKMVDGFSRKFRGVDLFAVQNAV
jgi:hypothetical protein